MTEFELHQLVISTRYEFDTPFSLFILVSFGLIAASMLKNSPMPVSSIRLIQFAYLAFCAFIIIRFWAAVVRLVKLAGLLEELNPTFEFWWEPIKNATGPVRLLCFISLIVVTLISLNRTENKQVDRQ